MNKRTTILLYGRSGSGKSTMIGQLAEHVYATTGKKSRVYTADRGGMDAIQPYIDLGILEAVTMDDTDPFIFLNKACKGFTRDSAGKWVLNDNSHLGFIAYESLRAFAESLMQSMVTKAASGVNIGGSGNVNFNVVDGTDAVKIGGSNMAMFGIAQQRMTDEVWNSQKLNVPYLMWTSSVSKDDDTIATGKVLGPDVIGKALTTEVPRWFNLTFRIDVIPAQSGKAERHLLYLGSHVDVGAGNAAGMGNTRMPIDAPALAKYVIEPASIVTALQQIAGGSEAAKAAIKKRLGL